jgi:hypothetical protein
MAQKRSHLTQMPPGFRLYQQRSSSLQALFNGEGYLVELISTGAPLPAVWNSMRTATSAQARHVAPFSLPPDGDDHRPHTTAQSASHVELPMVPPASIFSPSGDPAGTPGMCRRFLRTPAAGETKLNPRATRLAALAFQRHEHEKDSGSFSRYGRAATERSSHEMPWARN